MCRQQQQQQREPVYGDTVALMPVKCWFSIFLVYSNRKLPILVFCVNLMLYSSVVELGLPNDTKYYILYTDCITAQNRRSYL